MLRFFVILVIFLSTSLHAQSIPSSNNSAGATHVIYVTLDGTRWQDFFGKDTFFKQLWKNYGQKAMFYGGEISDRYMEVASIPVSLPSYQSQMAGTVQPCNGNDCGRIRTETFPEYLLKKYRWAKKDVAIFSSWETVDFAVQQVPNTLYVNTGNKPVYEPDSGTADTVMQALNRQQAQNPDPKGNRYDKYTFAQALHYFDKYRPKFLWISLVNADDAAHSKDLALYQDTLRFYDQALCRLLHFITSDPTLKNTLVIVTTDHGRGNGKYWTEHGTLFPESKRTWAFVLNGKLKPDAVKNNVSYYSTLSIRPTIEAAFAN